MSVQRGKIKWFDRLKGYGFIVDDESCEDILLRGQILRNFGQASVTEGARVLFEASQTSRGLQAEIIHAIFSDEENYNFDSSSFGADVNIEEARARKTLAPGRVKWFDPQKGFGFINLFDDLEDIFVHIEILRSCGMSDLEQGQAVAIKEIKTQRGRMAIEVRAWDFGLRPHSFDPISNTNPK